MFNGTDTFAGGINNDRLIVDYSDVDVGLGIQTSFNSDADGGFKGYFFINQPNRVDFTSVEAFTITGTRYGDAIVTRTGDDAVNGGDGNDVVDTGSGKDVDNGGAGSTDRPRPHRAARRGHHLQPREWQTARGVGELDEGVRVSLRRQDQQRRRHVRHPPRALQRRGDERRGQRHDEHLWRLRQVLRRERDRHVDGRLLRHRHRSGDADQHRGRFHERRLPGILLRRQQHPHRLTGAEVFNITATNNNDTITGGTGADKFTGLDGRDSLAGNGGNDTLDGGAAADTLDGGQGKDTLIAGGGADTLTGGTEADTFVFKSADFGPVDPFYIDRITDFATGSDKIDLTGIDANTGMGGDQAFTFVGNSAFTAAGQVHVVTGAGGFLYLEGNWNADLAAGLRDPHRRQRSDRHGHRALRTGSERPSPLA